MGRAEHQTALGGRASLRGVRGSGGRGWGHDDGRQIEYVVVADVGVSGLAGGWVGDGAGDGAAAGGAGVVVQPGHACKTNIEENQE